jgi:hypothetical protein
MRYVRARRLTKAAQALATGAPDILSLALDADYSSHEAFTRAFRDHFGVTPEAVRARNVPRSSQASEPIVMDSTLLDTLKPPRFETSKPLLIAGIGERCTHENGGAGIPNQWQQFHQKVDGIPARIGKVAYASAATATMPAISTTSPASRSPTSPTCRASSRACGFRNRNTPSSPTLSTSRHPPHRQHDLESLAADLRHEGGRRAVLRAIRRKIRSGHRQWRLEIWVPVTE